MTESSNATHPAEREIEKAVARAAEAMPRRGYIAGLVHQVSGRWSARIGFIWVGVLIAFAVFAPVLANSHPILWKHVVEGDVASGTAVYAISSPMIEHLTWVDVSLALSFLAAVGLFCFRRIPAGTRIAMWLWLTAVAIAASSWPTAARWLGQLDSGDGMGLKFVMLGVGALTVLLALCIVPLKARVSLESWSVLGLIAVVMVGGLSINQVSPPQAQVLSKYREAKAAGDVEWMITAVLPYSAIDRQRDVLSATGEDPRLKKPGRQYLMGTTEDGADVASRMIHATRIALAIGLIATGIAVVIGVTVGALMGYFAQTVDLIGMRFVEVFSAIPVIFLLIMIVAFYGRDLILIMTVLGLTGWVGYALFVRAEFLKLRNMDYVMAAKATGTPLISILFRHILPNGLTPVLVLIPFGIASAILYESVLSFLGLGLVDQPSWGQLLQQARSSGLRQWGLLIFPGLAIFLTVLAYNLIGEALRDAMDPRSAKR